MKTIDAMRTHISNLRYQGLTQVAMVDVEKCLDEIEREMEEEYVELPKDANGEHIHIGDKLMGKYLTGNPVVECTRLTLTNGWMVGHGRQDGTASLFVHHKLPTVEDEIRSIVQLCFNIKERGERWSVDDVMQSGNVSDVVAKLRLREEEQ